MRKKSDTFENHFEVMEMRTILESKKSIFRIIGKYFLLALIFLSLQTNSAWSFADLGPYDGHESITNEAFSSGIAGVDFSKGAILQIIRINKKADKLIFGEGEQFQHFDDEFLIEGSLYVKYLRLSVKNLLIAGNEVSLDAYQFRGFRARRVLGLALHAIQDYYSHTNWVEAGNTQINFDLGVNELPPPAPSNIPLCTNDSNDLIAGLGVITSGYWEGLGVACAPLSSNQIKCRHGTPITNNCGGLNKDTAVRPNYDTARSLAVTATQKFVEQVINDIKNDPSLSADVKNEAIRLLADQPSSWNCGCVIYI